MSRALLAVCLVSVGLGLAGCALPTDDPKPGAHPPFHAELLRVAAEYPTWGRVDHEARFAPLFCRPPDPAVARLSASPDPDTHGRKLYSLFAKDRKQYVYPTEQAAAVGQVIVKEAWVPEEVTDVKPGDIDHQKAVRRRIGDEADTFYPYAAKDGKVYRASKPAGLFIMMKLAPGTPGTDDGWVYGTVSADGKTVTSAGRVESCTGCHQTAKRDRLFGLAAK